MTHKKKEYRTEEESPSVMFVDSVMNWEMGAGCDEMECGFCGRLHLCPDNRYVERDNDDIEAYQKYCDESKKKNPDGVVLNYDCDSVSSYEFSGLTFVIDCPCNGLSRYERFIWEHRGTIREYLKNRIQQEYDWAQQELTRNKLAGFEDPDKKKFFGNF